MGVSLLPNGKQQFEDGNGDPLAGGSVYMYVPNTSPPIFSTTWQDINQIAANTNPIVLDADGRCIIWGNEIYRQVVYDFLGNLVWDELTSAPYSISNPPPGVTSFYDPEVFMEGKPDAGEVFPIVNVVRNLLLPAGLPLTICTIEPGFLPTAPITITLKKNSTAIGTWVISTLGVVTTSFLNPISFAPSDQWSIVWPGAQDATAANISITLVFTVVP